MSLTERAMHTLGRIIAAAAVAALVVNLAGRAHASRWGKEYLPNVPVVTQDGATLRFYDDVLQGKTVLISFIYTSCRDICPLITARLAQVYEQLGEAAGRDVHFVSISIDPSNDTPVRLKRHADAFRSDPRWLFLTGEPRHIDLVRFKLGERSRSLTEHGAQVMLYNDRTGEWARDSAFADQGVLALTIRAMDPTWRGPSADKATRDTSAPIVELPGQALFAKACASCHTIGRGDRVGPDLKDVSARRERHWLQRFIRAPSQLHAENDPVAHALAAAYPKVRMPNLQLSEPDVLDLISYVDARSFAATAAATDPAPRAHHHYGHHHHPKSAHGNHGRTPASHSGAVPANIRNGNDPAHAQVAHEQPATSAAIAKEQRPR